MKKGGIRTWRGAVGMPRLNNSASTTEVAEGQKVENRREEIRKEKAHKIR